MPPFDQDNPSNVFKYTEINGNLLKSLKDGYLWLSKPIDFNDPYDCYEKLVKANLSEESVRNMIMPIKGKSVEEKEFIIDKILSKKDSFDELVSGSLKELYSDVGICCFTLNDFNDILMWSHYSDNHKGICLKFDISKAPTTFSKLLEVNYTKEFVSVEYDMESTDALIHFVTTKSEVWGNENEARRIRLLSQNPSQKLRFPRECLTEIAFGCKTSFDDVKSVFDIIKKDFPHTKVYHMKMEESKFELSAIEGYLYG